MGEGELFRGAERERERERERRRGGEEEKAAQPISGPFSKLARLTIWWELVGGGDGRRVD